MNYEEIKENLADEEFIINNGFFLLREISNFINSPKNHDYGRDLIIRALSVKKKFHPSFLPILFSLVRSVGLFPYLTEFRDELDFDDYLAYEMHRAEKLEENIIFHSLQAQIYNQLILGKNVVLSASTSVGKSFIIDALIAKKIYSNIVIVVPTIALIDETRKRVIKRFNTQCKLITHPSQSAEEGKINIYVLTQERVLDRDDLNHIDFFVIDEFYKMSLKTHSRDYERCVDLNLAFHKLAGTSAKFYLLGPNVGSISGLQNYEFHFIPSEFSTVAVDIEHFDFTKNDEDRAAKLIELCNSHDGPTLIYCQSPKSASNVAKILCEEIQNEVDPEAINAGAWLDEEYHPDWILSKAIKNGIGIHHAATPRAIQQYLIKLFNERKLKYLVCTSTIIEGVNTVAKNVIIYDKRVSTANFDYFTYKNISGRAGRMTQYFVGKVFVLEKPPEQENFTVDFPIGRQNDHTPISLLLELPEDDLTELSRDRLFEAYAQSNLSIEATKKNRHIPIDIQNDISRVINNDLLLYEDILVWSGIPDGPQLIGVCELIYKNLEKHTLDGYKIFSGKALAREIVLLNKRDGLSSYIKLKINESDDISVSETIERSLGFIRNFICYKFSRSLMAIDTIQSDIFQSNAKKPGNYSLFANMVENLFIPSTIFALDEYGIPIQTSERLIKYLPKTEFLDEIIDELKTLDINNLDLSNFEKKLLINAIQTY